MFSPTAFLLFLFQHCIKFFLLNFLVWFLVSQTQFSWIGLSVISWEFHSRFLKCSFLSWSLTSWLTEFNFALVVMLLPFISVTICHSISDFLSSTEFLISSIWSPMYSNYSFWWLVLSRLWHFFIECGCIFFCYLGFFLKLPLTPIYLYIRLLVLFGMHSAAFLHLPHICC